MQNKDVQNQTVNKKELLKQMQTILSTYYNMYWAFKNAELEKEAQIKDLGKKVEALKKEVEAEDKKVVEKA